MACLHHRFFCAAMMLVLIQMMVAPNLPAQNPLVKQWDLRFGGSDGEYLFSFQKTYDGGYILGGSSTSGISGDKTEPAWGSGHDYWIIKIDSFGNKLWDKRFGGFADDVLYAMQQTTDGGYILGGYSQSGSGGDKTQPSWGDFDYWIVKIDSLGMKQWDKRFGGTSWDILYSVLQTSDGGYILGGGSKSGISGDKTQPSWGVNFDFWVVKIDSLGNKQWDKRYGGTLDDDMKALQQTSDGGFILGGASLSGIGGDKSEPSWGQNDYWVVKIDSIGNKQWDKRFGGALPDAFCTLKQTKEGGFILGGWSGSGIGGDKTQSSWGSFDYWIVKVDSLGYKQWDKRYGGTNYERLSDIFLVDDGGYLLSGESKSSISGDKTENNLGTNQTWIIRTDSLGNKKWDKTLRTISTYTSEIGFSVKTNVNSYLIANSNNAGIGGDKTQSSQGYTDYWIIKYCDTTGLGPPPSSIFSSSDTSFCEKQCIDFTDLSTNNPTSWQWFFPGADSTTSTLQNPTNICYSNYGSFDVTLIACNAAGCDTLVLHNFINEYQNPIDSIYLSNDTLYSLPAFSYQWYETASGIIAGATNQFYVYSQPGSYFCLVTDSVGCEATSNVLLITAVPPLVFGEGLGVRILPNPVFDFISIDFPFNQYQKNILEIFDANGSVVLKDIFDDKNKSINVSQLAKGVYGYRIFSSDKIEAQGKFVKM